MHTLNIELSAGIFLANGLATVLKDYHLMCKY